MLQLFSEIMIKSRLIPIILIALCTLIGCFVGIKNDESISNKMLIIWIVGMFLFLVIIAVKMLFTWS